jgi:hypothetical protein
MLKVLGIDIASSAWSSNGSAVIGFEPSSGTFHDLEPAVIRWPAASLTPTTLAEAIDRYARDHRICAVALDGPQGWRDPATPEGVPGVGRRCEYESRTQAKTGVYPVTFPGTQRPWIEFCIDVSPHCSRRTAFLSPILLRRDAPRGQGTRCWNATPPPHGERAVCRHCPVSPRSQRWRRTSRALPRHTHCPSPPTTS